MFDLFDPDLANKDPSDYSWLQYLSIIALGIWGGTVNYLRKRKANATPFIVKEYAAEVFTSAFAGVLTFWACELMGVPPLGTAIACAIAGHSAGKTIALYEDFFKARSNDPKA